MGFSDLGRSFHLNWVFKAELKESLLIKTEHLAFVKLLKCTAFMKYKFSGKK